MNFLLKLTDINPYASLKQVPFSPNKITDKGTEYIRIGAYEQFLNKWERVCLALKALFFTIITGGFGLISKSLRSEWSLVVKGTKTAFVYREIPSPLNVVIPPAKIEYREVPSSLDVGVPLPVQIESDKISSINANIKAPKNFTEFPEDLLHYTCSFLTLEEGVKVLQTNKKFASTICKKQAKLAENLLQQIKTHFDSENTIIAKLDEISKKYAAIIPTSKDLPTTLHEMFLEVVREISTLPNPVKQLKAINLEQRALALGLVIPRYFLSTITKITTAEDNIRNWIEKDDRVDHKAPPLKRDIMACYRIGAPLLATDLLANTKKYEAYSKVQSAQSYLRDQNRFLNNPAERIARECDFEKASIMSMSQRITSAFDTLCDYCMYFINVKKYDEAAQLASNLSTIASKIKSNDDYLCSILLLWMILAKLDKVKTPTYDKKIKTFIDESIVKAKKDSFYVKKSMQLCCFYLISNKRYDEMVEYLEKFEEQVRLHEDHVHIPRYMYYRLIADIIKKGDARSIINAMAFCEKIKNPKVQSGIKGQLNRRIELLREKRQAWTPSENELFIKFSNETLIEREMFNNEHFRAHDTIFENIDRDPYYSWLGISHFNFSIFTSDSHEKYIPY